MWNDFLVFLHDSQIGVLVRETSAFPWIETLHVLAIVTVFGTISIIDLRLLGVASHRRSISALLNDLIPFTWGAFVLAVVTGSLLFMSNAAGYAANRPFQIKFFVILAAGLNMMAFNLVTSRTIALWDESPTTPFAAKFAGSTSLLLWTAVIVLGRWIGFTLY